jgi:hypothetical protein
MTPHELKLLEQIVIAAVPEIFDAERETTLPLILAPTLGELELFVMEYTPVPPLTSTVAVSPVGIVRPFWLNVSADEPLVETLTAAVSHIPVDETKQTVRFVVPAVFAVTVIWLPLKATFATEGFELFERKNGPPVLAVITPDWPTVRERFVWLRENEELVPEVYGHAMEFDCCPSTVTYTLPPGVILYDAVLSVIERSPFEFVVPIDCRADVDRLSRRTLSFASALVTLTATLSPLFV